LTTKAFFRTRPLPKWPPISDGPAIAIWLAHNPSAVAAQIIAAGEKARTGASHVELPTHPEIPVSTGW
jgi:hypothetical protein